MPTLPMDILYPFGFHGSCFRSGLSTRDHPMDSTEIDFSKVFEQGFGGNEPHGGIYRPKVIDSRDSILSVLHGNAQPCIAWCRLFGEVATQARRPLRQYLIGVARCFFDDRKHAVEEFVRDILMEQIGHGVDEIDCRFASAQWLLQSVLHQGQSKAIVVTGSPHALQALRHGFHITVFASRRNLGAARCRVPGLFRPFDT